MENKETKNELIESEEMETSLVPGVQQLSTGLFAGTENKTKKITSLDLSKEENIDMVINATQEVDFKLNECINKEIVCVGCLATEKEVDYMNEETGEYTTRKKHTLMLFDKDGKSYVTGSNACYMSFETIVALKGMPTEEKPLVLIPIKTDAKEKGHSYLKLKLKASK